MTQETIAPTPKMNNWPTYAFYGVSAVGTMAGAGLLWHYAYFDFPRNNFYLFVMLSASALATLSSILIVNSLAQDSIDGGAFSLASGLVTSFAWSTLISMTVCLLVSVLSVSIFYLSLLVLGTGLILLCFFFSAHTIYGFSTQSHKTQRDGWSWISLALTLAVCYAWYEGVSRDYTYQTGFTSSHLFIGKAHQNKQLQNDEIQDGGLASQALPAIAQLRQEVAQQKDLSLRAIPLTKKKIAKSIEKLQTPLSEEIKRHPEKAKPLIQQASALIERKQRQNFATELLQRAYALDPLDPVLLRKLGAAEVRTHQYDSALTRFAVALRIEPTKPDNWLGYADAMAMQPETEDLAVVQLESSIEAHLTGYWFALDRKEVLRRLNTEPRPFTNEKNTKMDLTAKIAIHRIARVDSQISEELPPLPDLSSFKAYAPKFLEHAEKSMARQSYEEARAHAFNTLAIASDNKAAMVVLRKIEAIERGEKPEGPGVWARFKSWLKRLF